MSLYPGIDVIAPVRTLRVAQCQIVEIAKALRARARIIATDKPTSSLTPKEFERLVEVIHTLTAQGVSVIYVSHKLDEVLRLCQTATILRDARRISAVPIPQTPVERLIETMVGRELAHASHSNFATVRAVLRVENLSRGTAVQDASFDIPVGEVLGIVGPVGSGRTEL